jgi:CheY-like chemotaxis protein
MSDRFGGALIAAALAVVLAATPAAAGFPGKKILYVDSYHAAYDPSRIQQAFLRKILGPEGVQVEVVYLDEKRRGDTKSLQEASRAALERYRALRPDVVVAADDAASQYFVVPYLKDAATPVVFIGVNWSGAAYGYPFTNVTGQVEVEVVRELADALAALAKGRRVALLTGDTMTDRKSVEQYEKVLGLAFTEVRLVKGYEAWKEAYRSLQKGADILIFRNNSGIDGWDDGDARSFVLANTFVPTGTVSVHMAPLVLVSFAKVNAEFGEWAGETVLRILAGIPPSRIPVTMNKRAWITLNMPLAKKLGVVFPMDLMERATFVGEP